MKVLVVLGHPRPGSFNHAISEITIQALQDMGHEPVLHDLYQEKFDPVMPVEEIDQEPHELPADIQAAMQEIRECRGMIFIHPNWWGGPPAILRGWLDRVVRDGFAYRFTEKGPEKFFNDKIVQIFSTSNTPRDVELNVYRDPIEWFWKVIVFGLCGCESFERRNFEPIVRSSLEDRHQWLKEVVEIVKRRFPE